LILGACVVLTPSAARAGFIFNVPPTGYGPALNAANLAMNVNNIPGPYAIEVALTNPGNATNTIVIDNFNFGGGSASGSPSYIGVASGDLSTSVTLTDNNTFIQNLFFQGFTPGSDISFTVDAQTTGGGDPTVNSPADVFQFFLLGNYTGGTSGEALATDDPSGANSLATLVIDDPTNPTLAFNHLLLFQETSAVPEPASLSLLLLGLTALGARRWWRR